MQRQVRRFRETVGDPMGAFRCFETESFDRGSSFEFSPAGEKTREEILDLMAGDEKLQSLAAELEADERQQMIET